MKSWEVLRDAADRIGVKALAAKLKVSTALVYKWCQDSSSDDPAASGARNPLDRVIAIYEATGDERVLNWVCMQAAGSFVRNPERVDGDIEDSLLSSTQRFVEQFAGLLAAVSSSVEDDGQITPDEAARIRQTWECLKTRAETFVMACEEGRYMKQPPQ